MDADLRERISDRLPSVEEQAADATAAAAPVPAEAAAAGKREAPARVTLPPTTLARALPHIRRLMGRGDGEGGGGLASVGGTLGLLRGGGLVFPEAHAAASAALKQTEVSGRGGRSRWERGREGRADMACLLLKCVFACVAFCFCA